MTYTQALKDFFRILEYMDKNFRMDEAFGSMVSQGATIVFGLN